MHSVPMTLVHSVVHVTLDLQEMASYVIKNVVRSFVIQMVAVNHLVHELLASVILDTMEID